MNKILFFLLASIYTFNLNAQDLKNASYVTSTGEKVLKLEFVLPVDKGIAWEYFTKDEKLRQWIAPLAHIELKTGGYILTNYNKNESLRGKHMIRLNIINYIEGEMITLKVKLNSNFSKKVQSEDQNLQEIIQFSQIDNKHTKITSSMIGWGKGADWEKTYKFFVKGNEWTYNEMMKLFKE